MTTMDIVEYGGWKRCARVRSRQVELVATLDVGPRVMRFAALDGPNLFKEFPDQLGRTSGSEWCIWGGHRLWHAPEVFPRTYAPDFEPVDWAWDGETLSLEQRVEPTTGIEKGIELTVSGATVLASHSLTNRNPWAIEVAAWALTIMAPGGRAIVPQEPYRPHPEALEPARPIVVWPYTRMNDPRFTWGDRLIQLRQDDTVPSKQKFGARNAQGWAAYQLRDQLFMKTFPCDAAATYPDMGCNCEFFTQPGFLEVESLSPLVRLEPGATVRHVERWSLWTGVSLPDREPELVDALEAYFERV
jgi:hypothetical protein